MATEGALSPAVTTERAVLEEAFISLVTNLNLNVVPPGDPVRYDTIIRSTISGLSLVGAVPIPDINFLNPGLYLMIYNINLVPGSSVTSRYGLRYDLSIGGVIQTIPRIFGKVWDQSSVNQQGNNFTFTVDITTPNTLFRLWAMKVGGATGAIDTQNGSSLSILRLT